MQLGFEHSPANNLHLNYKAIHFSVWCLGYFPFPEVHMTLSNSIPAVSTAATVLLVAYNNLRKRCFQFWNFVSLQNVLNVLSQGMISIHIQVN